MFHSLLLNFELKMTQGHDLESLTLIKIVSCNV